jgi:adenosylcobinamide-phosphate synthase
VVSRLAGRALGAAIGVLADRRFGEPPVRPHPVAAFGTAMTAVERRLWADSRARGVAHAGAGLALGFGAGRLVRSTAACTYVAVAGRGLGEAARAVRDALERGDLELARTRLPHLAGRDAGQLDEAAIARAVVESVAENTVDAVVAPALWAAVGGAPGVLAHRAANTMDAMVGHRSARYARYGWASARLDDGMAWVPARVTAALVATVRPVSAGAVWRTVRRDAPTHPSPNAGVAEAAFAAALGLRLGGPLRYGGRDEVRAVLGDGRPPVTADIDPAVRLADDVGLVLTALLALPALVRLLGALPACVGNDRTERGGGR